MRLNDIFFLIFSLRTFEISSHFEDKYATLFSACDNYNVLNCHIYTYTYIRTHTRAHVPTHPRTHTRARFLMKTSDKILGKLGEII